MESALEEGRLQKGWEGGIWGAGKLAAGRDSGK